MIALDTNVLARFAVADDQHPDGSRSASIEMPIKRQAGFRLQEMTAGPDWVLELRLGSTEPGSRNYHRAGGKRGSPDRRNERMPPPPLLEEIRAFRTG